MTHRQALRVFQEEEEASFFRELLPAVRLMDDHYATTISFR